MSSPNFRVKVLVADDHGVMREVLRAMMEESGFETVEAVNGLDALHKISARPDLILMDVQMPIMDGVAATAEIKKIAPDIKIIGLSISDPILVERLKRAGADAFVDKDKIHHELMKTISSVLGHNSQNNKTGNTERNRG